MSGKPDLAGQTVVVIGGTSGIGLETARRARAEGAEVILTARDADRLKRVGAELGARTAAFDATDFERLGKFFDEFSATIDHVLVTGPGPYYAPLVEFDFEKARRDLEAHLLLPLKVAMCAVGKVRPGGDAPLHGRHGRPAIGAGTGTDLGSRGCWSRHDAEPRARACAHPREHDRGGVCRHAAVGRDSQRPAGKTPRAAATDTTNP